MTCSFRRDRRGRVSIACRAASSGTSPSARTSRCRGGAAYSTFADYDNDGWLDLFVVGGERRGHLLHNRGDGTFEEVTARAGVANVGGARKALFVDLDHDGDLDLLLVGGGRPNAYRNNLDGTFTEAAQALGLAGGADARDAAFGDFDGDGRTDLFVAGENDNALLHNAGVQGFSDVTPTSRPRQPRRVWSDGCRRLQQRRIARPLRRAMAVASRRCGRTGEMARSLATAARVLSSERSVPSRGWRHRSWTTTTMGGSICSLEARHFRAALRPRAVSLSERPHREIPRPIDGDSGRCASGGRVRHRGLRRR